MQLLFILKISLWSVLAFTASGIIAYVWTNELYLSTGIALTEFCVKLTMFAIFEYIWKKYSNENAIEDNTITNV